MPLDPIGKTLLENICLKKGTDCPEVRVPNTFLDILLLGEDLENKPNYFTHYI